MAYAATVFTEKPPIVTGQNSKDIANLRDYLFRMAQSLSEAAGAEAASGSYSISYGKDGRQILTPGGGSSSGNRDIDDMRRNALELRSLIIKRAGELQAQIDGIELGDWYIRFADKFEGDFPEKMFPIPGESTYYMGVCTDGGKAAPADPAAYTWFLVRTEWGQTTETELVLLYRRWDGQPDGPALEAAYSFGSKTLALRVYSVEGKLLRGALGSVEGRKASLEDAQVKGGLLALGGWSQSIPEEDGRPCWAVGAAALAQAGQETDRIPAEAWSEPVQLTEEGELKSALALLYTRSETEKSIDWTEALSWSFEANGLEKLPEGWQTGIPEGESPLYATAAAALSDGATDSIALTEWRRPVHIEEPGWDRRTLLGVPGPAGKDGKSYLHIKFSGDGESFTAHRGEELGEWIGLYIDNSEADSEEFRAYDWQKFFDENALRELIREGDSYVMEYVERKIEEYNSLYVAKSEFGSFTEEISSVIETTARGVVESYDYQSSIESVQDSIGLLQSYFTSIQGEIRRGIVQDPETGEYVTGIAIAQNLKFAGECGPEDSRNPKDGYTYYYMTEGQTFGLYTSTGWQFWIDGYKKGWFDSRDGMLHVANIVVENALQIGSSWQIRSSGDEFEIVYTGD